MWEFLGRHRRRRDALAALSEPLLEPMEVEEGGVDVEAVVPAEPVQQVRSAKENPGPATTAPSS